jgi:hypothetical protein
MMGKGERAPLLVRRDAADARIESLRKMRSWIIERSGTSRAGRCDWKPRGKASEVSQLNLGGLGRVQWSSGKVSWLKRRGRPDITAVRRSALGWG